MKMLTAIVQATYPGFSLGSTFLQQINKIAAKYQGILARKNPIMNLQKQHNPINVQGLHSGLQIRITKYNNYAKDLYFVWITIQEGRKKGKGKGKGKGGKGIIGKVSLVCLRGKGRDIAFSFQIFRRLERFGCF